ncbi:MAG: dienelactone hydrolase family protein [Thermoanaerobaculia bacterium]
MAVPQTSSQALIELLYRFSLCQGNSCNAKRYDGAGHAFMNPKNKGGYVKEAAADAWKRIDSVLRKRLRRS